MNILVYNVAASNGGAATVLQDYCKEFSKDTQNQYYLLLSNCSVKSTENLHPIYNPWIKKSWLHRIWFDTVIAPNFIKKYHIDEVFSLQNTLFPRIHVPSKLLVHNAIPFSDYKFRFFKTPLYWIRQNIIGQVCLNSVRKADQVIVQTEWMKKACVEKTGKNPEKIHVAAPATPIAPCMFQSASHQGKIQFFYPASAVPFKNHQVIIDACRYLKEQDLYHYEVLFTLRGDENRNIAKMKEIIEKEDLPIRFIGWQDPQHIWDYYCKSILLFASYLESAGLPLLEAMACKAPILAADCTYARYITDGYDNVNYFEAQEPKALADQIIFFQNTSQYL